MAYGGAVQLAAARKTLRVVAGENTAIEKHGRDVGELFFVVVVGDALVVNQAPGVCHFVGEHARERFW